MCVLSHVQLFCDPLAYTCQAPLSIHGVFQARILEWVAISSSRGSSRPKDQTQVSRVSCIAGRSFTIESRGSSRKQVKVAQSCLTLCDPMDYTVHEILQASILEWVAFPFSRGLPNPGMEPRSPALQADSLPADPREAPVKQSRA